MHFSMGLAVTLATLIGLATTPAARAGISFQLGNHPQLNEENILLNTGDTGNPIFGTTNQSGISVRFSSTTDTLTAPASGQARVESTDGAIQNLTVDIPNGFYHDLIINPNVDNQHDGGTAHITVVTNDVTGTFDYTLNNGSNFLTIVATGTETLLSTTIDYANGFQDLRQPRISGPFSAVPEPSAISLSLLGLGGIGLIRALRRKRK
jgi:hypothetical protein